MKWVNNIMPYGSKATGILPMLSKIALHGNVIKLGFVIPK